MSVFYADSAHHPLSAANAKNRVRNAHGGTGRRSSTCAHSNSTICKANVRYTHTTSRAWWVMHMEDSRDSRDHASRSWLALGVALSDPLSIFSWLLKRHGKLFLFCCVVDTLSGSLISRGEQVHYSFVQTASRLLFRADAGSFSGHQKLV